MPEVRPFTGLLYDTNVAGPIRDLTTPPYDAISVTDRDRYYAANPFNVVRLILGREEPGDVSRANRYARAAEYLERWRGAGVLVPTRSPAVYPYELRFLHGGAKREVRGVIAEIGLEPWGGSIIPHERTLPGPIEDRLMLLRAVRTNLSPVYAVFDGPSPLLGDFLDSSMSSQPARELMDEAGTLHRLWVWPDTDGDVRRTLRDETVMIADGHHRYAVALAFRKEMRAAVGPGPWDSMMMLLVDAATENPPVLPFHRVVSNGIAPPAGGQPVRDLAELLALLRDDDLTFGSIRREGGEIVHRVDKLDGEPPTVCALHEQILADVPASRLRFVPDAVEAEEQVRGGAPAAYLLPPTRAELVRSVIETRGQLPEKSTFFWPKPRTGMVMRPLES